MYYRCFRGLKPWIFRALQNKIVLLQKFGSKCTPSPRKRRNANRKADALLLRYFASYL